MNKNFVIVILVLIVIGMVVFPFLQNKKLDQTESNQKNEATENIISPSETIKEDAIVPLPQETDIIRSFVNLIDEGKPNEAVQMMGPTVLKDDSSKQAWAVMFNGFEKIQVLSIEPSMKENWTAEVHTYKVTLDVLMKPEAENVMPIPNYGYDNGENIRFIGLEKDSEKWTIQGLATGP